jgi:uncharacterized protein YhfF
MPTPIPELDVPAALSLWNEYRAATPDAPAEVEPVVDTFGDSPELADELLGLVLAGTKTATATLVLEFADAGEPLPRIGDHWVACDSSGAPRAVLRTVELRVGVAGSVDDGFAFDEGEDDRSRDSWLEQHRKYWTRVCEARGRAWDEELEVVFERILVVWPPEARTHLPEVG